MATRDLNCFSLPEGFVDCGDPDELFPFDGLFKRRIGYVVETRDGKRFRRLMIVRADSGGKPLYQLGAKYQVSNTARNTELGGVLVNEFYVLTTDGAWFITADYAGDDFSQGAKLYSYAAEGDREKAEVVAWFKDAVLVIRNPPTIAREDEPVLAS
jgi:hypothetical protein